MIFIIICSWCKSVEVKTFLHFEGSNFQYCVLGILALKNVHLRSCDLDLDLLYLAPREKNQIFKKKIFKKNIIKKILLLYLKKKITQLVF